LVADVELLRRETGQLRKVVPGDLGAVISGSVIEGDTEIEIAEREGAGLGGEAILAERTEAEQAGLALDVLKLRNGALDIGDPDGAVLRACCGRLTGERVGGSDRPWSRSISSQK
jgi:hypothetical protein